MTSDLFIEKIAKMGVIETACQLTDIKEILKKSQGKCFYCQQYVQLIYNFVREPKQWTIERIDNSIGHNKGNVEISCLHCNLQRKTMHYEKYLQTKQLKIYQPK